MFFFSADDLRTRGGHNFGQVILSALKTSRHFLLSCSPNAMASEWVELEHDTFFQQYHLKNQKERGFYIAEGPDFESQLVPEFYRRIQAIRTAEELLQSLSGKKMAAPKPAAAQKIPPASTSSAAEDIAWEFTEEANTRAGYERFLTKFPDGHYASAARQHLATFEADDTAWEFASHHPSASSLEKYLKKFPNGQHAAAAKKELAEIKAEAARKSARFDKDMVFVKGGAFLMGSPASEADRNESEHQHEVEVSDFCIGKYAVTVEAFAKFIEATKYQIDADNAGTSRIWTTQWEDVTGVNWKCNTRGNPRPVSEYNHPVLHVSWNDALAYCQWLSEQSGKTFRLPTEAEWEYAARGGGQGSLFGNGKNKADPKEINFSGSEANKKPYSIAGLYRGNTVPVGSLNCPNALGLHDMSGNIYEWCADWYGAYYYQKSPRKNPSGPESGSSRVFRGGSWDDGPRSCRVAFRGNATPSIRAADIGFRLAKTV
ncbi:MAG TPA: SUMF1/EgtB/PvdO family nonheme iron enzyme [Saprospiraceae bacterium]|nr:SUMF1/EgtB/PvdO family nonheme iron enzyme [Saprospiraceae bacterium]